MFWRLFIIIRGFMRKKIRFFINTLSGGGAERVLVDLLKKLNPNEYDVSLLTILGGVYQKDIPSYVKHKCLVKNANTRLDVFWGKVLFHLPRWIFALLFLRGKFEVEVAYIEGYATRFLSALRTKAKKIAFVHCDVSNKNMISSFYRNKEECLREYNQFNKVCFVSEQARCGFINAIGNLSNAVVVHNIIDYDKIKSLSKIPVDKIYTTKGLKLISVGRLTEVKGYKRLLQVLAELKGKYDFELWILGEGEQREELESYIQENNLDCVHLLGFCQNPYPYIRQADFLVSSSFSEGYSTVVAEAVALGIPVLTTSTAGMSEILLNGRLGSIVENTTEGLKQGLLFLFAEREKIQSSNTNISQSVIEISHNQAVDEYKNLFMV